MVGLVSKARKEKQMATLKVNKREREENIEAWVSIKITKLCKNCGLETPGVYKDGRNVCHKCGCVL